MSEPRFSSYSPTKKTPDGVWNYGVVLGVGEHSPIGCLTRGVGSKVVKILVSLLLYSPPTSSEPRFSSYSPTKKTPDGVWNYGVVLGVGVEPTKAEAGRFTV